MAKKQETEVKEGSGPTYPVLPESSYIYVQHGMKKSDYERDTIEGEKVEGYVPRPIINIK